MGSLLVLGGHGLTPVAGRLDLNPGPCPLNREKTVVKNCEFALC